MGKVQSTPGSEHDYLGMTIWITDNEKITLDMTDYVDNMIAEFPVGLKGKTSPTPATENLFKAGQGRKLDTSKKEIFHTTVARGLFLSKRARPDIHPTIAVLCTRVREPYESDWDKLIRMMKYLQGTRDKVLTLKADDIHVIKWYVDTSFAVHPDFRSHTGMTMTMGQGAVQTMSRKQKLNTRSSTEAELVGADDAIGQILWTKMFLEEQGYKVEKNILYQDNKSAILLETNGQKSAGKRSRALNVRYFFITDQVQRGNVSIEYCPTGDMVGDFMTKPLQGAKYQQFVNEIMGHEREPDGNKKVGFSD